MSNPLLPVKTPQGHEELRQRTLRLSQRHRTLLLLVDGRRTLSEALSLAQQAGVPASVFEDLVRLGLVEVPSAAMAPDPVETQAGALDPLPRLTAVEVAVEPPAPVEPAAPAAPAGDLPGEPPVQPSIDAAIEPATPQPPMPAPPQATAPAAVDEPVPAAEAAAEPALPALLSEPVPVREMAPAPADARELLLDALRLDAPVRGLRLAAQVRRAETPKALIALVWDIERLLGGARRPSAGRAALQRARDLLGLGNTMFTEDTHPGRFDDF